MARFILLDAVGVGNCAFNVDEIVTILPSYNNDNKSAPPVLVIGQAVLTFNHKPNFLVYGSPKSIMEMIETGAPVPVGGGGLLS